MCAMPEELVPLQRFLGDSLEVHKINDTEITFYTGEYKGLKVAIIKTGIGLINAGITATTLIQHCNPRIMLFSGVAGDPNQTMAIGDIIIATSSFDDTALTHQKLADDGWAISEMRRKASDELVEATHKVSDRSGISRYYGVVMSSNYYPAPPNFKELVSKEKVIAVDMETVAFYQACDMYKIPHLCVRSPCNGISNSENEIMEKKPVDIASHNAAGFCFDLISYIADHKEKYMHQVENPDIEILVKELNLAPHPEGGFYRQTHRSTHMVGVPEEAYSDNERSAGTSIYFLLKSTDFSAWHRVKSDEIWNYHKGSPLTVHMLNEDTGEYTTVIIGDPIAHNGAAPQFTVPANVWFAASVNEPNSYSLVGCAVHPGFEFSDFELAEKNYLRAKFPDYTPAVNQYICKKNSENSMFFKSPVLVEVDESRQKSGSYFQLT
jgi:hypothetical protein